MTTPPPAGREASQILGPPGAIRLRQVAPSRLGHHLETLAQLAHAAYTPRPWHAAPAEINRLIDRLTHDAQHLGFTLLLADNPAGRPVGVAYGRPACHLAALADRPPPSTTLPFEVRELAVAPTACGHGIGAALHDTLTATAPPGPRWLMTHPHAAPALALYRARGWQTSKLLTLPNGTIRILMHRPA
ncbi:GNAT family N-acetyltransferase [Streptomyces spiralis]|uniref:GNAT family N-acetyltransferase n=1 Tax=Streptomyces spiralis TaxID=66376 RepID=UPI003693CB79